MARSSGYRDQDCSLARTLEVIGERWTLLVVRDAFYGVRSFGDFAAHLAVPRAVLADRLATLTGAGVLERRGNGRSTTYQLTDKGRALWPALLTLMYWGSEHEDEHGPNRVFRHAEDGGEITGPSRCTSCGAQVDPADVEMLPGPGLPPAHGSEDRISAALRAPHRLLVPLIEPAQSS